MEERKDHKLPISAQFTAQHYEILAKWLTEVALLLLASLVVQKISLGQVTDPVLYSSGVISLILHYAAVRALLSYNGNDPTIEPSWRRPPTVRRGTPEPGTATSHVRVAMPP
jgi:hypothetical protein